MMKLAIITPGFLPVPALKGGAVEQLTESLIKDNEIKKIFDIDIYTINYSGLNNIVYNNSKIIQVKVSFFDKLYSKFYNLFHRFFYDKGDFIRRYTVAIKRKLLNKKYDIILVENNMTVVNYINKKNMVFHLHNDILDSSKTLYQCKQVINKCDLILTVSNYLKKRMYTIDKCNKIKVFYNCVDFNIFDKNLKIDTVHLKKKYGISKSDFVFVYTGRIVPEKGIFELLLAFEKMLVDNAKIKLIITGNNPIHGSNPSKFDKNLDEVFNRLSKNVIYTGYIDHNEIPQILKISDCVIIPSKWDEPFGVVALEAMAMKKAIIATNSGGLVEPLNKECAIIIERENLVENLYNSMEKLYKDEKLRERLANNAYERVHSIKDFNKEYYFDNFLKLSGIEDENSNENK